MRALLATLCALTLVACGPARRDDDRDRDPSDEAPDAAHVTPDGGNNTEPDGGHIAPDGGNNTEPDGGHTEPDGGTPNNGAPSATIATPANGGGDITIRILLFDAESDLLSVSLEWDDQSGAGFRPATVRSATSGLASAPDGVEHTLTWGSASDLANRQADVRLRLTPRDGRAGAAAQTFSFTVDNRRPNTAPTLGWGGIPATIRGDVVLSVNAADAESDTLTFNIEYRVGAGVWSAATLSSPPATVTAMPAGVQVPFTWSSAADVPANASSVQLRARANDPQTSSAPVESASFAVQNSVSPPPNGVRFTEIHTGEDADWVEIMNFGTTAADLRQWKLRWGSGSETGTATIAGAMSSGYILSPDHFLVVTDEQGTNGSGTIYLSDSSSQQNIRWGSGFDGYAELVDAGGTVVDFVRWGGSTTQPTVGPWSEPSVLHVPHDGASLVRQGAVDRDSSVDFCAAPSSRGLANSTTCYPAPAASVRVRMTEISPGSSVLAWIEIVNGSGTSLDLRDWSVHSTSAEGIGIAVLRSVIVPANGGRLVVRSGTGTDSNGTMFTGTNGTITLGNTSYVSLRDPTGAPHDFVRWNLTTTPPPPVTWSGGTVPTPSGTYPLTRTTEIFSTLAADVSPQKWCAATMATPNAMSAGCRTSPNTRGVRLSEVKAGDTFFGGSAIEIENTSTNSSVALPDLQIVVNGTVTPLFGAGIGPGQRVSFNGCTIFNSTNCIADLWNVDIGGVAAIELQDSLSKQLDFVRFGGSSVNPSSGTGWSESTALPAAQANTSLGRRAGAADTDSAADWCKQSSSIGASNNSCIP